MKMITPDNMIFASEEYQKDKYKFNLIAQNLKSPTLELYSDESNYIVCRGNKKFPTWIWTKDNLDPSVLPEIMKVMDLYLTENERDKFTCKKELYDLLVSSNYEHLNPEDYFEMGFLICSKTKAPRSCDCVIDTPNERDKDTLIKYWYDDCSEMSGVDSISLEQAIKDVESFLTSGKFYVLRNKEGKIVSMASYGVTDNTAKLSHVYTPDEERKKGYAAYLIYLMTNDLLKQGLVPLLYTDYNYIPSNKAYINAGYEDKGILINFSCSKVKNQTLK